MKVIFNDCFGMFNWNDAALLYFEKHGYDEMACYEYENRTNPVFVEYVEKHKIRCNGTDLELAIIPENATDWWIDEYDGLEKVWYVLDGKRHSAKVAKDV